MFLFIYPKAYCLDFSLPSPNSVFLGHVKIAQNSDLIAFMSRDGTPQQNTGSAKFNVKGSTGYALVKNCVYQLISHLIL